MLTATPTAADYRAAFEAERQREYPVVAAFEARCGYAVGRRRLETAAGVLACPVKKNPPNWQHGRVLYALTRAYLVGKPSGCWNLLDIGTAKGFSALCLQWALNDHAGGAETWGVKSVDVIAPDARVRRNTIAEVDGLLTLAETLAQWPESRHITFLESTGVDYLAADHTNLSEQHIHIAFVDGSHDGTIVQREGRLLSERQEQGDIAVFDDVDRPDIGAAVASLSDAYRIEVLEVLPKRAYAIGVRR